MATEIRYHCDMPDCDNGLSRPFLENRPNGWVLVHITTETDDAPKNSYGPPQVQEALLFCERCWKEHWKGDLRAAAQSLVHMKVHIEHLKRTHQEDKK